MKYIFDCLFNVNILIKNNNFTFNISKNTKVSYVYNIIQ